MHRTIFFIIIFSLLSAFTVESETAPPPYWEIVSFALIPKLKADYAFPVSVQFKNGCFAFAVKHIVEYKYAQNINLYEAEKKISKPRTDLWTHEHIKNFLNTYQLKLTWYNRADIFFKLLINGEPVMIQYKYSLSGASWVGHFVAVYSFDAEGVFAADSISGKRIHLPYNMVFDQSGKYTQFPFAVVEKI
ncbi:MAG: hypothetical protein JW822_05005 [Spirochaetales bacterium]|nr:hypothetical protein [Spirochaetales bacterium]